MEGLWKMDSASISHKADLRILSVIPHKPQHWQHKCQQVALAIAPGKRSQHEAGERSSCPPLMLSSPYFEAQGSFPVPPPLLHSVSDHVLQLLVWSLNYVI